MCTRGVTALPLLRAPESLLIVVESSGNNVLSNIWLFYSNAVTLFPAITRVVCTGGFVCSALCTGNVRVFRASHRYSGKGEGPQLSLVAYSVSVLSGETTCARIRARLLPVCLRIRSRRRP